MYHNYSSESLLHNKDIWSVAHRGLWDETERQMNLDVGPLCSREEVKDFYTNENAQFPIFPAFLDPLPHNFLLLPPTDYYKYTRDRLVHVHLVYFIG